jgi:hypothetical protein
LVSSLAAGRSAGCLMALLTSKRHLTLSEKVRQRREM